MLDKEHLQSLIVAYLESYSTEKTTKQNIEMFFLEKCKKEISAAIITLVKNGVIAPDINFNLRVVPSKVKVYE